MRKIFTFFVVALFCVSAYAQVTFNVGNDVRWNPYGWENKWDMMAGLAEDWNALTGQTRTWGTAPTVSGNINAQTNNDFLQLMSVSTPTSSRWHWLTRYILAVSSNQSHGSFATLNNPNAAVASAGPIWRASVDAFFFNNRLNLGLWHESPIFTGIGADYPDVFLPFWTRRVAGVVVGYNSFVAPTTLTSTTPVPIRDGYDFVGWFDNPAGTGNAITELASGTVYAVWTSSAPGGYITFVLNGGSPLAVNPMPYDGVTAVPLPTKTERQFYSFEGWYTTSGFISGTRMIYTPIGQSGNFTLYARWENAVGGTIEFNLMGASWNTQNWNSKSDMFEDFKADIDAFGAAGGNWLSLAEYRNAVAEGINVWNNAPPLGLSAFGVKLTNANIIVLNEPRWEWLRYYIISVADIPATIVGNEAAWRFNTAAFWAESPPIGWPHSADFTIAGLPRSFNDAFEFGKIPTPYFTGRADWTLCKPKKAGHTFLGWFECDEFTGTAKTVIPEGTLADFELFANWLPLGNGTGIEEQEVTNSLHVFGSNGQISVAADNRIESVRVFDLQGRTIHTVTGISLNEYSVAASQGVYIVEVTTTAGRVVKRVIVK